MNKVVQYLIVLSLFLCSGCEGLEKEHLIDNYYIIKQDYVDSERDLSYHLKSGNFIGVVNPTVIAVGYNEEYIIVKQYPHEFSDSPYDSITNYFIVPIKEKVHNSPDENKIGPLTESEFKSKRQELKISEELKFTKVYK